MAIVTGGNGQHTRCRLCGGEHRRISTTLGVCPSCIREQPAASLQIADTVHEHRRQTYGLPAEPPGDGSVHCTVCANDCRIGYGEAGYCGLRENVRDMLIERQGILRTQYESPPGECPGASSCGADGYILNVFVYGCTFDCLHCPHPEHRRIDEVKRLGIPTLQQLARQASCIRFHGGAPEPQLPFLLEATEHILEQGEARICWELNGSAAPDLTRQAARHAGASGGRVTVTLTARDEAIHRALTGRSNRRPLAAVGMLAADFDPSMLAVATPLIPGYVDTEEVASVAMFVASCSPDISHLLLPLQDGTAVGLPSTTDEQAERCRAAAAKYLNRVHICSLASARVESPL